MSTMGSMVRVMASLADLVWWTSPVTTLLLALLLPPPSSSLLLLLLLLPSGSRAKGSEEGEELIIAGV